jgi:hypothetical protein
MAGEALVQGVLLLPLSSDSLSLVLADSSPSGESDQRLISNYLHWSGCVR